MAHLVSQTSPHRAALGRQASRRVGHEGVTKRDLTKRLVRQLFSFGRPALIRFGWSCFLGLSARGRSVGFSLILAGPNASDLSRNQLEKHCTKRAFLCDAWVVVSLLVEFMIAFPGADLFSLRGRRGSRFWIAYWACVRLSFVCVFPFVFPPKPRMHGYLCWAVDLSFGRCLDYAGNGQDRHVVQRAEI